MKDANAAGRKTDPVLAAQARQDTQLSAQLEILTSAMRTSVARADETTRDTDEYGHYRGGEIDRAIRIADVSARLGVAIAKIAGEFNHNITVRRDDTPKRDAGTDPHPEDEELAPFEMPTSHPDPLRNSRIKEWWAEEAAMEAERTAAEYQEAKAAADRALAEKRKQDAGGTPLG